MDFANARIEFYSKLVSLIVRDCEARKSAIRDSSPDSLARRRAINEECREDLMKLRRWYWGRKADMHCADCEYYSFWEAHVFNQEGGDS